MHKSDGGLRAAGHGMVTAVILSLCLTLGLAAQDLSRTSATAAGMSADRLDRIGALLQGYVDDGEVAGAVSVVVRDGILVSVETAGWADLATDRSMEANTIFRIASMTKAVTSAAIMMLQEDGHLLITDPLSRYLPEFQNPQVLVADDGDASGWARVPSRRAITIRDLLTHQSGITYGFINSGPAGNGYRESGVSDGLHVHEDLTLAENIRRLAEHPLIHHPGDAYSYGLNTDVLGRVIEVVSGRTLEQFLSERLFQPLGMVDTHFWVPDADVARIATPYTREGDGLRPIANPERFGNAVLAGEGSRGSRMYSGGAGLYSTAVDYARFLGMLMNGGELDGVRVMSPKSIELMTVSHSAHLGPNIGGPGQSFGLGFAVVEDLGALSTLGSPGLYRWAGIYGTDYWVDPVERIVAVLMIQRYPTGGLRLARDYRVAVYQAIADSFSPRAATRSGAGGSP